MSVVAEIEERALRLGARERGQLITRLLRSLPEFPSGDEDGVAEALRRRDELRENPEIGISLDELDRRNGVMDEPDRIHYRSRPPSDSH